ncbi:MAG TPA: NAD-dependent epimerase/dehydratase family protein [Terriglobales bacterium]|jgi:nucleoside-diphosphate-sugar epimerase|nr:NAD-dependent epimerase/dehydratase family protein [Terriglobales bacterium]
MFNDLQKKSVGLVGANGFIGATILRALLQQGIVPRALCGPIGSPRSLPDGVDFVTCDLAEVERLKSWVTGLEVVIHAAGPPSVQRSFEMAEAYVRVQVEGTVALLRACRMAKVKRIVYISSAEVYGRPEANPVAETHRLQARSPYAAAKIGAEKMIEAHVESFGLEAVILRPFSIYGPHFHSDSLLSRIVSTAKSGCVRVRDLRPVRDYCHVGDLAVAVLQACCIGDDKLRTINIGSGVGTSVAEFAELVLRTLGLNIPITEDPDPRPGQSEIFELVADITTARDVLGWRPTTALLEGLCLTLSIEHDRIEPRKI